ncbi:hypothetical protein [Rhodanobacter lindaniclasticus]
MSRTMRRSGGSPLAALSRDGNTLLVHDGKDYQAIDLTADKPEPKDVKLDGLFARVDPKAEYAEIFNDVWRRYRDYFYVTNMNGYDWNAIRAKYQPLLQYVGDRTDLNYVLGQMIAELSNSHTYVAGGDLGLPDKPHVGLLGASFDSTRPAGATASPACSPARTTSRATARRSPRSAWTSRPAITSWRSTAHR